MLGVTVYASNSLYQVYNQLAAEPEPTRLREHVHALQLRAPGVEAGDTPARDRAAAFVADDEEDAVRLDEHRRLAHRADVRLSFVQPAHLRLLRVRQSPNVGVFERFRPRTHRSWSRAGPPSRPSTARSRSG